MQCGQFEFGSSDQRLKLRVWCRSPPEAQAGKTLSWQLDGGVVAPLQAAAQHAGEAGTAPPAAATPSPAGGAAHGSGGSSAPADAADPDLIGLDLWPASIALCRYLAAHPQLVAGQHVLELGAGMGLVGLLCAALGASQVLLTDYEPHVLTHLDRNAALNGLQQRCASLRLDWREPAASLAPHQLAAWRVVVAADVLYASAVVQPLIATLQLLLHSEGVALIGHQMRRSVVLDPATRLPRLEDSDEPLERFTTACSAAGLQLRVLSTQATCSSRDTDPMVLLAVGGSAAQLGDLPADCGDA